MDKGEKEKMQVKGKQIDNVGIKLIYICFQLRAALRRAEQELEGRQGSVPCAELQKWLQLTYEIELQHHNAKKIAAEQQLVDAKECVSNTHTHTFLNICICIFTCAHTSIVYNCV